MDVTFTITLDPLNPLHISFLQWKETIQNSDLINAILCGFSIVSTNILDKILIKPKYESESDKLKMEEQCEQWISKYDKLYKEYNTYIKGSIDTFKDKEIHELRQQLFVLQNTNIYKGDIGEKKLKDILQKEFIGYEIQDTSMQQNMSDIHLIDRNGYIVAIESKNKSIISTSDVTKSLQDIKHLKNKFADKFIAYFFASIRSNNIPKKGDLFFEMIENIPVIWYGTENIHELEQDVTKLIRMLYMYRIYNKKKDDINYSVHINDYITKITEIRKSITTINNTMKSSINTMQNSLDWMYDDMIKILGGISKPLHICSHCKTEYKRKGDLDRHITKKHS